MLAWRMGSDYSYCIAQELFFWPSFFLNEGQHRKTSKAHALGRMDLAHRAGMNPFCKCIASEV